MKLPEWFLIPTFAFALFGSAFAAPFAFLSGHTILGFVLITFNIFLFYLLSYWLFKD